MLTSDPTSDSSDTGSSSKDNRMHSHNSSKMDMDYKTSSSESNSAKQVKPDYIITVDYRPKQLKSNFFFM